MMNYKTKKKLLRLKIQKIIKSQLLKNAEYACYFEKKALELYNNLKFSTSASVVLGYYPMQDEAPCLKILNDAITKHKKICLPKIDGNSMSFFFCNSLEPNDDFLQNSYGIYEPINKNLFDIKTFSSTQDYTIVAIIPGLAFTKTGKRLGRGKGYYDSFLASLLELKTSNIQIIKVGLCFSCQLLNEIPTEKHDILMDFVITEKGLNNCNLNRKSGNSILNN